MHKGLCTTLRFLWTVWRANSPEASVQLHNAQWVLVWPICVWSHVWISHSIFLASVATGFVGINRSLFATTAAFGYQELLT